MKFPAQNGNALFLILIAVALFAALGYAISQSGRGGGASTAKETTELMAAQLVSYASLVEQTVSRLRMTGCTEAQISFDNAVFAHVNAAAPADKSCHVFDNAGGGLSYMKWPDSVSVPVYSGSPRYGKPYFSGANDFVDIPGGVYSHPSAATKELAMFVSFLTADACLAVNRKIAGFTSVGNIPAEANDFHRTLWTGAYVTGGGALGHWAGTGLSLSGYRTGCFSGISNATPPSTIAPPGEASGEYIFYHVLIAH